MNPNSTWDREATQRRIHDRLQWIAAQGPRSRVEPRPPWKVWLKQRIKALLLRMPLVGLWLIWLRWVVLSFIRRKPR